MASKSSGVGFFGLLTIVFIVLKLLNKIDWSWFWVLSPLFLPMTIIVIGAIFLAIVKGIFKTIQQRIKQKKGIKILEEIKANKLGNNVKSKWEERYTQVLETQRKTQEIINKNK
jgi:ABC-type bacteriocin/lantibiotic exporter with double-glycine peptidase domain